MKKTYAIEVDCANCALKMEQAVAKTPGVLGATVNFMGQKLVVEFQEGADADAVIREAQRRCRRVTDDGVIYL